MQHEWVIWIAFALCLIISFVLSGMESGVFALSRLRIRQQMRTGRRSATVLHGYLENPENFLWTILVGNTVANFLILGWLVILLHRNLPRHPAWFALVFAVVVLVFYAVSDLLPKMLFRRYPTRLTVFFARPFRLLHLVLQPLVGVVELCSDLLLRWRGGKVFTGHLFGNREELRIVMQESAQTLTGEERMMINRVLDLQTLTVRQVMVPLAEAVTVGANSRIADVLALGRERRLTRFPVWESRDGGRRIVGLVSLNPLLYQSNVDSTRPMADFVRPALFLEEDLRLEVALRRMQRGAQRLAIVLSRDRREIGLLSLQDVLKVIFGAVTL
ncbi:MAG TPA: CNNM domain-containing protein [Verrucomicrobiae bacterium]|nr:CNNM domain-containing protein [Verrucomicrobiae bacterium]